jgi:hypothetical protein
MTAMRVVPVRAQSITLLLLLLYAYFDTNLTFALVCCDLHSRRLGRADGLHNDERRDQRDEHRDSAQSEPDEA